jgi:hypothetical protein
MSYNVQIYVLRQFITMKLFVIPVKFVYFTKRYLMGTFGHFEAEGKSKKLAHNGSRI